MSDKQEKLSILQTLTVCNLKEICEKNYLKGYSGTKKELAKFMVDNLEISLEELKNICNIYQIDKLLVKIRDGQDHFLNKRVTIRCRDKISPIVDVGGHRVIINNLGKEDFSYLCDDKCAVPVLLKLVNRYREIPILNHDWIEPFFQKERVIKEEDVEEIFEHAEREIDLLSERLCTKLRERFKQFSQISGDAAFIKLDMKVVSSVLEEIISEMPELVIPERKGIVDYINIEHDYYEIWERILKRLGKEFVSILKETSFSQVKNTELKEDLLKMLKVK